MSLATEAASVLLSLVFLRLWCRTSSFLRRRESFSFSFSFSPLLLLRSLWERLRSLQLEVFCGLDCPTVVTAEVEEEEEEEVAAPVAGGALCPCLAAARAAC